MHTNKCHLIRWRRRKKYASIKKINNQSSNTKERGVLVSAKETKPNKKILKGPRIGSVSIEASYICQLERINIYI